MESEEIIAHFRKNQASDWINWIDDILYHGIAYPVYKFSLDGDPLLDIVSFLKENGISSKVYSQALLAVLNEHLGNVVYPNKVERMLTVLSIIKPAHSKFFLISILSNPTYNTVVLPSKSTLKSKIILILSHLLLEAEEISSIYKYCLQGFKKDYFTNDVSFAGNFLKFTQKTSSYKDYNNSLFFILDSISKLNFNDDIKASYYATIINNIEEYYSENESRFYSYFIDFIFCYYERLFSRVLFTGFVKQLVFEDDSSIFSLSTIFEALEDEKEKGIALYLIFALTSNEDRFGDLGLDDMFDAMVLLAKRNESLLSLILKTKRKFLSRSLFVYNNLITNNKDEQKYILGGYFEYKVLNQLIEVLHKQEFDNNNLSESDIDYLLDTSNYETRKRIQIDKMPHKSLNKRQLLGI